MLQQSQQDNDIVKRSDVPNKEYGPKESYNFSGTCMQMLKSRGVIQGFLYHQVDGMSNADSLF